MKKLLKMLVIVAVLMSITVGHSLAAELGFIDVEKVFYAYKETKIALEDLAKKEKEFRKQKEEKEEEILAMIREGKSQDDIEKKRKKLAEELEPKAKEIKAFNDKVTSDIRQDIIKAVKKIAKQLGIDTVLDKKAFISGGTDLTDLVVNKLNKGKYPLKT